MSAAKTIQQENEYERKFILDTILNKTALDVLLYSTVGLLAGSVVRIAAPRRIKHLTGYFFAGIGSSYAYVINRNNLKRFF